ncbi:MAG: type sorting protein [Flavisolibacter sp.]|nr:type sorting protein [Flavisolibacter sp.]
MKKLLLALLLVCCYPTYMLYAQCSGQTKCTINWDYLKFFPSAGLGTYTTLAHSQTQNFAFGTQKMTLTHNYTGSNALGEDALNTAELGSFGTGADIHFIGNGTITYTFQNPVDSIRFSIYDIDRSQRMTISATGAKVNLASLSGSILSLTANNTSSAKATASTGTVDNTDDNGTLNVLITDAVPISTFTITVTLTGTNSSPVETGEFWISDLSACSAGTFNSTYFQVSKPFTNQGGYVVISRQDSFYYVNPATGVSKFIFYDPGHTNVNSVAYDPVKHFIYYTYSLTGPGSPATINPANKTLRRYDYNVDTFGIVVNDITTLIPTFEQGVESGAAAFYDGSLYLGLEAKNTGGFKSIVWKVDFNAAGAPIAASQVFGIAGANHDWGDIAVANGTFYDFDASATNPGYYHQDLYTHNATLYTASGTNVPRQAAVDWNNNLFNLGSANVVNPPGTISPYNLNGTVNTGAQQTVTENGVSTTGSWGDGGEAFKPKVDFGDAPASFDPATGDPAVHEISTKLLLGTNTNNEWFSRGQTALANSDNFDDGVVLGSLVNPSAGTFFAQVKYLNNTGTTAKICAWVDFNNNGTYDAAEGLMQTNLPSSASTQTAFFNWTGVATSLVDGSYTFLRLRITTTANTMTTSTPNGFYDIGEVEDHRLVVTLNPLLTQLVKFTASKIQSNVSVDWQVANEETHLTYALQRSADAQNWINLSSFKTTQNKVDNRYSYIDALPLKGTSYYRLKMELNGTVYSQIQKIATTTTTILLQPNPAAEFINLILTTENATVLQLVIRDAGGRIVQQKNTAINAGVTNLPITLSTLSNGLYWVQMQLGNNRFSKKLIISK